MACHPVLINNNQSEGHKSKRGQHYIELCLNLQDAVKRPLVRCSNEEVAQRASRHVNIYFFVSQTKSCSKIDFSNDDSPFFRLFQINYGKSVYDERELTLNYETVIDT